MCGAISFANDPFFAYIISPDGLDRNFKPVDVSIELMDNQKIIIFRLGLPLHAASVSFNLFK